MTDRLSYLAKKYESGQTLSEEEDDELCAFVNQAIASLEDKPMTPEDQALINRNKELSQHVDRLNEEEEPKNPQGFQELSERLDKMERDIQWIRSQIRGIEPDLR